MTTPLNKGKVKKMWWKGKQIPYKEWEKKVENCKFKDMLMCHQCLKPFKRIDKYSAKPQCEHYSKSMRIDGYDNPTEQADRGDERIHDIRGCSINAQVQGGGD